MSSPAAPAVPLAALETADREHLVPLLQHHLPPPPLMSPGQDDADDLYPFAAVTRSSCSFHTPCYCEENVYRLVKWLQGILEPRRRRRRERPEGAEEAADVWEGEEVFAVFVSSVAKRDYHVIAIYYPTPQAPLRDLLPQRRSATASSPPRTTTQHPPRAYFPPLVFDQDTTLPFPCLLEDYAAIALPPQFFGIPEEELTAEDLEEERRYRVVPATVLLKHFASDRSHMRRESGEWIAKPPEEPCIKTAESTMNLPKYWNVARPDASSATDDDGKLGRVMTEDEFLEFFGVKDRVMERFRIISCIETKLAKMTNPHSHHHHHGSTAPPGPRGLSPHPIPSGLQAEVEAVHHDPSLVTFADPLQAGPRHQPPHKAPKDLREEVELAHHDPVAVHLADPAHDGPREHPPHPHHVPGAVEHAGPRTVRKRLAGGG
ncbi:hypothetical protein HDU96_001399 [Phlyctochytrium bullatum]|nr:hypothetical protein HDU96_001399 [Phlyctochytrium bullatum]